MWIKAAIIINACVQSIPIHVFVVQVRAISAYQVPPTAYVLITTFFSSGLFYSSSFKHNAC